MGNVNIPHNSTRPRHEFVSPNRFYPKETVENTMPQTYDEAVSYYAARLDAEVNADIDCYDGRPDIQQSVIEEAARNLVKTRILQIPVVELVAHHTDGVVVPFPLSLDTRDRYYEM